MADLSEVVWGPSSGGGEVSALVQPSSAELFSVVFD